MRPLLLFPAIALVAGCGTPQAQVRPAATASTTAIAIEVVQDTVLAGRFEADLAANLRQRLLESRAGVPVTDVTRADLVLRVHVLEVNFSNAVRWEWQLLDPQTGAIVASQTDSAAMGRNAGPLANDIIGAVAALDLTPYGGDGRAVAAAAAAQPAVAAGNPASATDGRNAWAVIVGIESYREKLPAATGAEADARAFAELAKTTLNVPESNIKLLVGDRASRADLTGALTEWLPRNAVQPGGRIYVFFSGHGAPDVEDGTAYLLPWDANPAYIKSGGYSVQGLQDGLAALKGQEVFVFLDACFSGVGDRTVIAEGTRPLVPVREVAPVGSVVTFAASGAAQTTGAAPSGRHGLFSWHLLDGLRGAADADRDGDIEIGELHAHVAAVVSAEARRQNREQTPTLAAPDGAAQRALISGLR